MSAEITISKWGNSQGLRLPKEVINALDIHIGDKVKITVEEDRAVIVPIHKKKYDIESLVAAIPEGYTPEGELFDDAVGQEIW